MRVTLNVSLHENNVAASRPVQWSVFYFREDLPDMIIANEGLCILADFTAMKAKDKVLPMSQLAYVVFDAK